MQDLEQKLHKEMLAREGEQREEEQKAKDLERERLRQELIDEMRQQQLAQLAEIKKEVRCACRLPKHLCSLHPLWSLSGKGLPDAVTISPAYLTVVV